MREHTKHTTRVCPAGSCWCAWEAAWESQTFLSAPPPRPRAAGWERPVGSVWGQAARVAAPSSGPLVQSFLPSPLLYFGCTWRMHFLLSLASAQGAEPPNSLTGGEVQSREPSSGGGLSPGFSPFHDHSADLNGAWGRQLGYRLHSRDKAKEALVLESKVPL